MQVYSVIHTSMAYFWAKPHSRQHWETHRAPFTDNDRQELERALLDTFISIDREIARRDHHPWINIYGVQEFLFRFWGQRNQDNDTGYLFTLNQDLFFERNLYNEHAYGAPGGTLPGLVPVYGQNWFSANVGAFSPDLVMRPVVDPPRQGQLRGQMNVIKLHGSFNWRSADGRNVLVVGTDKTAQIASLPLLSWYADVFRRAISAGEVRLMITGYGFGDEHVNASIADAIEDHGLEVFIWNTTADLKARVLRRRMA